MKLAEIQELTKAGAEKNAENELIKKKAERRGELARIKEEERERNARLASYRKYASVGIKEQAQKGNHSFKNNEQSRTPF